MKSTELRIGNYVKDPYGKVIKLVSVESDASMLRPIPLTEEWLLKLGGIETSEQSNIYFKAKRKTIIFDWSSRIVSPSKRVGFYCRKYPHIKYVHQLQNLYFSLTGDNLQLLNI